MNKIDNKVLKALYSNLTILFDLLKPALNNVELLKNNDEDEYKKLLRTSIVSTYTDKNFPIITEEKQELIGDIKQQQLGLDTVSLCNLILFS